MHRLSVVYFQTRSAIVLNEWQTTASVFEHSAELSLGSLWESRKEFSEPQQPIRSMEPKSDFPPPSLNSEGLLMWDLSSKRVCG